MKTYLISVGIDRYDPTVYGNANLKQCVADADRFTEWLAPDDLIRLYNEEATSGAVIGALQEIAREAKAGDEVWWYQSSHGTYGPPEQGKLLPTARCMYNRPLWDYEIQLYLRAFAPGVHIFAISDCCHSESNTRTIAKPPIDDNEYWAAKAVRVDLSATMPTRHSPKRIAAMLTTISACKHFQVAIETSAGGVFTNAFMAQATPGKTLKKVMYDVSKSTEKYGQQPVYELHRSRIYLNSPFRK